MSNTQDNIIGTNELKSIKTKTDLLRHLKSHQYPLEKVLETINYENQLIRLQTELVKLQRWVIKNNKKIAIIFEGRDAAGKGGSIRRFTEHLDRRHMRVVALSKPTRLEKGQWYFRRYVKELPDVGEIVFFDRSWYNRAVVEPVMGFCTKKEYRKFMQQVPELELMIYEDGVDLIKFWFDISKEEQAARFKSRKSHKLKRWKLSPVDLEAQKMWNKFTKHKDEMFIRTHTSFSPWIIVEANNKNIARLESIRVVLAALRYPKNEEDLEFINPDPNHVYRYYRKEFRLN